MSDKRRAILPRMRCDDDVGAEITRLRAEVLEQARLLGMSGEREAKLRARVEVLEKSIAARLSKSRGYDQQRTYGNDDLYRRAQEEREP